MRSGVTDIRQCLVTRARRPAGEMIRFVLDPENRVVPDIRRRLPGRGVWVSADRRLVAEAARKRLFARGFRQQAVVDGDLSATVERLLEEDALAALSLARKSGLVVTGFDKTRAQLAKGGVFALIAAADGAEDGRSKLLRLATASREGHKPVPVVDVFGSEALSGALGYERVVHGALLHGALAARVCDKAARLASYRTGTTDPAERPRIAGVDHPDGKISSEQEAV